MKKSLLALAITIGSSSYAVADDYNWALGVNAGLRGLGVDVIWKANEHLNLRGSFSQLKISESFEESDVDYDGDLKLQTTGLMLDYYPFSGSFRLSVGYFSNGSEITARAKASSGTVEINGFDYDVSNERVYADADWDSGAPYAGIGWGNPVNPGSPWTVTLDVGVLFADSPEVTITASQGLYVAATAAGRDLQADIDAEEKDLNNDLSDYDLLPVVQLGLTYAL